jgi:hypothetical protein
MSYDRDEIENYVMGSDLWAGMADPILKPGVNDSVFWDLLNQKCPGFAKHLDSPENRNVALVLYCQKVPGSPIICSEMNTLIRKLIQIAYPGFVDPHAAPPASVDERPRDRNGRLMSPKAQKWAEFEKWVNDAQTSSRQVDVRRNSDPEFREFYSTMLRREISSTPVGDAVENLLEPQAPSKKKITGVDEEELRLWCQQYITLPMTEVRKIMSPAVSGQVVADHNKKLLEAGIAAGLIA